MTNLRMLRMKLKLMMCLLFLVSAQVHAEACTYDEAMLALERGNAVRAQALLKMAARDGDARAQRMLASLQLPPVAEHAQHSLSLGVASKTFPYSAAN